jgi:hypothetical protein
LRGIKRAPAVAYYVEFPKTLALWVNLLHHIKFFLTLKISDMPRRHDQTEQG